MVKSYIDCLVCENTKTGEIIAEDYHIRMKGVCNGSILSYCDKNNITPWKLYEKLFNGEEIEFNILDGCAGFKNLNYQIYSLNEFKRKIKF